MVDPHVRKLSCGGSPGMKPERQGNIRLVDSLSVSRSSTSSRILNEMKTEIFTDRELGVVFRLNLGPLRFIRQVLGQSLAWTLRYGSYLSYLRKIAGTQRYGAVLLLPGDPLDSSSLYIRFQV